ncbi:DUF1828 domain-containing protein [Halochromatium roseum]|uniref:DUF1828 domain-containing protein n=1 Tax=Halochromatium roseum TaxID=391920 RepID=UPI0019119B06|nr:DUF1828 domain-containing protein [Halochromatium roseum]MBK5940045.1 hypothetical protein [Halochromatium roseum]
MTTPCKELANELSELFTCVTSERHTRIRTPFLYPDGDNIDLFITEKHGGLIVSDLGETLRWLRSQTLSPKRTPKQNAMIADVCLTHGIEQYKGTLLARCRSGMTLAAVTLRVAQACLRVSDLWFTFRTRAVESTADEVSDFLAERDIPFDRRPKLMGRSGRGWRPDFHIILPQQGSLVSVLSTGNRASARPVAEHTLAMWHDLNQLTYGAEALRLISLFDDTADVWQDEDFTLLDSLSEVRRWSEPEALVEALEATA